MRSEHKTNTAGWRFYRCAVVTLALYLGAGVAAPEWSGFDAGMAAFGRGDFDAALKALRPLAERGHAAAQFQLGAMYEHGLGVSPDQSVANEWYRRSAERGFARAQAALGYVYFTGKGVPEDRAEAERWCRKSAEQGFAGAYFLLGYMLFKDDPDFRKDNTKALAYYMVADALEDSPKIDELLDILAPLMTADQIAEAKRLVGECARQDYKGCEF